MNVRRERLGKLVRQRRLALDLSQRDAAVRANVSNQTWVNVEAGRKVSERTLLRVERTLAWPPGTTNVILAGRKPPPEAELADGPNLDRDRLLGVLATEDLTADEIEQVIAFVVRLWRERHAAAPSVEGMTRQSRSSS